MCEGLSLELAPPAFELLHLNPAFELCILTLHFNPAFETSSEPCIWNVHLSRPLDVVLQLSPFESAYYSLLIRKSVDNVWIRHALHQAVYLLSIYLDEAHKNGLQSKVIVLV